MDVALVARAYASIAKASYPLLNLDRVLGDLSRLLIALELGGLLGGLSRLSGLKLDRLLGVLSRLSGLNLDILLDGYSGLLSGLSRLLAGLLRLHLDNLPSLGDSLGNLGETGSFTPFLVFEALAAFGGAKSIKEEKPTEATERTKHTKQTADAPENKVKATRSRKAAATETAEEPTKKGIKETAKKSPEGTDAGTEKPKRDCKAAATKESGSGVATDIEARMAGTYCLNKIPKRHIHMLFIHPICPLRSALVMKQLADLILLLVSSPEHTDIWARCISPLHCAEYRSMSGESSRS
ncbi:uncharacterized protein N7515_004833 [Penicillium bovifimosum]|uniref:Uncharacterized protein n=1 Tax=Penicillium bovifimosum TaxID=126998 RepID=A0A9W9L2T3_9EURO|nr:uncharacterized protein N7515_004833 [Penicillium bovifimosum]KAJ5135555.1 hypothetical protein N7515_004833 [Penicillium bovifimosum]